MRALIILCALATVARAQPKPPPPSPDDPIGDKLFPPDRIMGHQQELGLDDATRKTIVAQIQQFQAAAVKIQWDLKAAGDALANLLAAPAVDEAKALAEADKVMTLEHDLKKAHLTLLIRLKNALTPTQQARLRGLRGH
ncbi:MAG TPA: periplasmic heavy metal sensor [Kofleriaceae bacterium]